jgi:hypothetical protein
MKTKRFANGRIDKILLVGCGGTGSFLAEHLCRMITGFRLDTGLALADGDIVEPANIWRQNFEIHEVGQNKAAALGLRLSGRFGVGIEVLNGYVNKNSVPTLRSMNGLVVTATDTFASRRMIAEAAPPLWLDVGNEKTFGQAIIGSTRSADELRKAYWGWHRKKGYVPALPNVAAIQPAILKARKPRKRAGCGQMPFASQGFGVNAMAALAAAVLAKQAVVDAVISTAAIYFDVDSGRMAQRLIDKELFRPWMRKEKND